MSSKQVSARQVSGTHSCTTAPVCDPRSRICCLRSRFLRSFHQELPEPCKETNHWHPGCELVSKMGSPEVGELWAEFSHGASLELSWAIHLPIQTGHLVITHAQWLFPAALSNHCSLSDMNSSLWALHVQPREFLQFFQLL